MNMSIKNLLLTLTLCLPMPFSAHAELVSVHYKTLGDGLLTRDTLTGLEWLDITYSLNRSYNDVSSQFGVGGYFQGFRYATETEAISFLQHAGLTVGGGGYLGETLPLTRLLDLVGRTVDTVDSDNTYGFVQPAISGDSPSMCHLGVRTDGYTEAFIISGPNMPDANWIDPTHGSYLVRSGATAPRVDGFWPCNAGAGDRVFVFGKNFSTPAEVCINSVCTNLVQVLAPDLQIFIVPPGISYGAIQVKTPAGSAISQTGFPYTSSGLGVTGFWPGQAKVGSIVFLFGSGFSPVPGAVKITVGGVQVLLLQVLSPDLVIFIVPGGGATVCTWQPIQVSVYGVTVVPPADLLILPCP
jgi:hypothetical protein